MSYSSDYGSGGPAAEARDAPFDIPWDLWDNTAPLHVWRAKEDLVVSGDFGAYAPVDPDRVWSDGEAIQRAVGAGPRGLDAVVGTPPDWKDTGGPDVSDVYADFVAASSEYFEFVNCEGFFVEPWKTGGDFTFWFEVFPDALSTQEYIFSSRDDSGGPGFIFYKRGSDDTLRWATYDDGGSSMIALSSTPANTFTAGEWSQVAVRGNGSQHDIVWEGSVVSTEATPTFQAAGTPGNVTPKIGVDTFGIGGIGSDFWNGGMRAWGIHAAFLTVAQIAQWHSWGRQEL